MLCFFFFPNLKTKCIHSTLIHLGCYNQWLSSKESACNTGDSGDVGSMPGGEGMPPEGGHGNPPQYSCLENSMGKGAWSAMVHGVTKSPKWWKWLSTSKNKVLQTGCLAKRNVASIVLEVGNLKSEFQHSLKFCKKILPGFRLWTFCVLTWSKWTGEWVLDRGKEGSL